MTGKNYAMAGVRNRVSTLMHMNYSHACLKGSSEHTYLLPTSTPVSPLPCSRTEYGMYMFRWGRTPHICIIITGIVVQTTGIGINNIFLMEPLAIVRFRFTTLREGKGVL